MRRKNRPDPLAAALSRSTSCSVRLLAELVENGKKARPLLMTSPLGGYHSALAAGDLVAAAMDMSKRRPRLMDLRRNTQENDTNQPDGKYDGSSSGPFPSRRKPY